MLYITRLVGEGIVISDNILLKVTKINEYPQGKSVNIGIQAPKDIKVMRSELLNQKESKK